MIETARKALRQATRTRRRWTWVWVLTVIGANLGLSVSIALMAEQRVTEIEQRLAERIELTVEAREAWRGELAAARSELGTEVAELRSELTALRQEVSTDDGDLRGGLDALGGRVSRIESMVTVLWRAPARGAQTRSN